MITRPVKYFYKRNAERNTDKAQNDIEQQLPRIGKGIVYEIKYGLMAEKAGKDNKRCN